MGIADARHKESNAKQVQKLANPAKRGSRLSVITSIFYKNKQANKLHQVT
jgi:hypothetical protein